MPPRPTFPRHQQHLKSSVLRRVPIEMIEETAVGTLDGIDVPMANVTNEYTYTLPDGSQGKGKACMLILPDADVWVGVGSEVKVGTSTWRVIKIHSPDDETGSVTLEKVSP